MEKIFEQLTDCILEWNEKINVTAIKDRDEFYKKNIQDSLSVAVCPQFAEGREVMDLGTGGGFPGLPLAISYPDKSFLLVDSVGKKLTVVSDTAEKLGLKNVKVLHSRAEDLPKTKKFDIVVSRAVADLSVLSEYCIPFVKTGGVFISYKTEDAMGEIKAAERAIDILGGKIEDIISDGTEGSGHLFVVVRKIKETPDKYPRKAGEPSKKPL